MRFSITLLLLCLAYQPGQAQVVRTYKLDEMVSKSFRTKRLNSACYLFQGFPDVVIGAAYGYSDSNARHFEEFLAVVLNENPQEKEDILADALRYISDRIYVNMIGQPVLVLDKEATVYSLALKAATPSFEGNHRAKTLALSLQYYFSLQKNRSNAKRLIVQLSKEVPEAASICLNLLIVGLDMQFTRAVLPGMHSPILSR